MFRNPKFVCVTNSLIGYLGLAPFDQTSIMILRTYHFRIIEKRRTLKNFMAQTSTKVNSNQLKKKTFDFKIAGVSYKIKTSHDEQTVEELVQFVNSKVSEALKATKNGSFQNAAVLAALNMAEEMLLLKKRAQAELEKLEKKAQKLSEDIENSKMNKVNWN